MKNVFITYLNAGILGSVIILVGLLLRPIFRKVPRRILCAVWLLAAIRLLLPFNIESRFSLQPNHESLTDLILNQQHQPEFALPDTPLSPGVPDIDPDIPSQNIPVTPEIPTPVPETLPHSLDWVQLLSLAWMIVMVSLLTYCIISYLVLKHRTRTAVRCEPGVLECENINGAFLLGYWKPKIYLPVGLNAQDRAFIIAHERIHIQRLDHWWKLIGVLCVAIHWYNPLVWIGYTLLCRDIEITCDERVIHSMELQERKAYSQALLNSTKRQFGILECPVAFGEVDLKQRILNILAYHPYGYWLTAFAFALVVFVALCFLTSPITGSELDSNPQILATQPTHSTTTEPATSAPVITTPAVTEPVVTEPIVTQPPVTQPPTTEPPTTEPPATQPSVTVLSFTNDKYGNRAYEITSDGTLTIFGNADSISYNRGRWEKYANMITKVVITEGCTLISEKFFQGFENLTEVYLCDSIEIISDYAFYGCNNLRYIRIPANVTTIRSAAFARCLALTTVEFSADSKITEIGSGAFGSTAITSFIAPPNLKTIDDSAFVNCWRLEKVVLRGSIEKIEMDAFENCTRLKHVVLGETLVSANSIFKGCNAIETVENYSKFPFEDFQ